MSATLIPATSSGPSLSRERAALAAERAAAEEDKYTNERAQRERESAITTLAIQVEKYLGVAVDRDNIQYDAEAKPPARIAIDGLTFAMVRYPSWSDRENLSVAVSCARGCGRPVWVEIIDYRLESLHRAITEPQTHVEDCLVQYDEDGEPTTDRLGNPLPPRVSIVPTPTPVDAAHLSIRLIEDAAEQCAQAHDTVTRLADERAEHKAAAILRLMATHNPLTNKQHSAASAEAVVETDPDYAAYRAVQRAAEVERWRALAHYESAKLVARLDVAMVETMRTHE